MSRDPIQAERIYRNALYAMQSYAGELFSHEPTDEDARRVEELAILAQKMHARANGPARRARSQDAVAAHARAHGRED